ncbi:MAG: tetratricopeptide repeat protein, partial [Acidobacteriia bacterium]|nr:tetratricopeptide repeat protein [Terriglobia bacterium]
GYYYNAVAQYNLRNYEKALKSALRAMELDPGHTVPLAEQLLGLLYSMQGDYKSAAQYYRAYIEHVPPTTNVDAIKARLAEAEAKIGQSGK